MMISVIIPFYRGNKYMPDLFRILKKNRDALNKQCLIDMEIIIVNDSPDVKVKTLDEMKDVRIINNKVNYGIQKARWIGIQVASGEYIMLLDQDDIIDEKCLVSQYKAIKNNDYVISNGYIMEANGINRLIYKNQKIQKNTLNIDYYYRCSNPIISPGQVLIKKKIFPKEWGNMQMEYHGADDLLLWLLLLENKKLHGVINPEPLYTHVYTGNNTSLNLSLMEKSNLEVLKFMKKKINKINKICFYRRIKYYSHLKNSFFYKLKFIDVAIIRKIYCK